MRPLEIIKCSRIIGNRLVFRDATPLDAEFILSLRTDEEKGRFLSKTSPDLEKQKEWLHGYQGSKGQAYFIIEHADGERLGTVRMYDARGDSFCWGSWLIIHGAAAFAAIESALVIYKYALLLGFRNSHFDVRKDNMSVWRFHEKFGATRVGETPDDFLYSVGEESIAASMERYKKYLPLDIEVTNYSEVSADH